VSTANAVVLQGAKPVFVDIEPQTLCMDIDCVKAAVTSSTKAIMPVHYAGVSCSMEQLMTLAAEKNVWIIEDAAQAVGAHWRGQPVGSRGHMSAFSFHESKNITSGGEGGVLCINDKSLVDRAEILCEKGTDRTRFFRGLVDKYTWVDKGSSYLMSDIQAAFLYAQLKRLQQVNNDRMKTWQRYYDALLPLQASGSIRLPDVPAEAQHNAHTFHLRLRDEAQRNDLLGFLNDNGIGAVFHYVPLHSSPFGQAHTVFRGKDVYTTAESVRLVRLPLFYGMSGQQVSAVIEAVRRFFA
jgi:dTDP-4-amino-4,6-dideoxygalactose transaminase